MLRIEHLSKAYGEKKAVDDLNLHIAPGEIYGFIGHNGAGKTTTLKSVAGILQFDQGEIYVDGKSIRTQPLECKRTFAYIPDNPDLYDYMTGIKYLNFVADIFGVSAADRQDRIRQYAGLFELTEDLAQPIAAYSHGMKQKLAIISAWLHRPRLILMDEPFVGLDPKAAHLLKGMMRQVCDEGGAIFFSTHVLEVAEKLCDKVAIIQGGRLIRSGTMEAAQNDAAEFTYTVENDAAAITGWQGGGEVLVIPDTLGGAPVVEIAAGAFADAPCKTVIFPDTLRRVQPGAFSGSAAESVTLFDNLQQISDYAFEDCTSLQTLYINAATAPVYSGSYYATFADKYDRLLSLADTQKLVLFSGSSARFGYDSAALDAALPHYEVVNMGVFAYTNALPQLELIRAQMRPGDLLLLSPEFDAAKRQFCTTNAFDDAFFCMAEADYDIVARLNLQQYSGVFSALGSYLQTRADMAARSYAVSPSDLDEDGNAVDTPSYNEYGDYVLYRPDAVDDTPIYGLPVDYTTASFPYDTYIAPANAEFDRFAADGVRVYLTYSPRNSRAVSADSTPEAVAALDAYFRENLDVVFLTPLQDSLMPGRYFYGTDNHLSTNGVTMRTAQVIDALTKQLQGEGIAP